MNTYKKGNTPGLRSLQALTVLMQDPAEGLYSTGRRILMRLSWPFSAGRYFCKGQLYEPVCI